MAHAVHNVLEAACKTLAVYLAKYDSGTKPVLNNQAYAELALWIGEQAARALGAKMSREARADFEAITVVSRRVVAGEKLDKASTSRLWAAANAEEGEDDGRNIVIAVALVSAEASINNVCGKGSRRAAAIAARLLGASFLDPLAVEIERLDAVTTIARQKLDVDGVIAASLWRGSTGAKPTHVIVRLVDGRHGLIAKTKGRWTWLVGERDDILASVPDAHMESAVAALFEKTSPAKKGGSSAAKASSKATTTSADDVTKVSCNVFAVAIGTDGSMWAASRDALIDWRKQVPNIVNAAVGKIDGMHAGKGGVVVTWGDKLTRWRDLRAESISGEKVDGAFVMDDGSILWWQGEEIHFGKKKKARGLEDQTIALDRKRGHLIAISKAGGLRFDLDGGKKIGELPIEASTFVLSPDGDRIATWSGATVTIASADDGKELQSLSVDSKKIDRVVFATNQTILVRYHDGKRVAVFDARGARTNRIQARDLNSPGSAIEELFPLSRGAILAFAPYPRGDLLQVNAAGQLLTRMQLANLYTGGKSILADAGDRVLFAHRRGSSSWLVRV